MNKKVCSVLKFCISMIMALFSIFTLFFSLWKIDTYLTKIGDNGFDFLGFNTQGASLDASSAYPNDMKSFSIVVGVILWLQLLFSIAYIIILLSLLFKKVNKKQTTYDNNIFNLNIICLMFSIIYMIFGFITRKNILNLLQDIDPVDFQVVTLGYVPFIISVVLLIMYVYVYFLDKTLGEENERIYSQKNLANDSKEADIKEKHLNLSDAEKIALVSKYYELVEKNILSQEDFEHKKNELLDL